MSLVEGRAEIKDPEFGFQMAWAIPQFNRSQVDVAGEMLVTQPGPDWQWWEKYDRALTVINNWRSSHSFPLNTFQVWLRRKTHEVDSSSFVAQRIKRLSSIAAKLRRFPTMKLSQMQDIGGCRAVVRSVHAVNRLRKLYETSELKHKLDHVDDYISHPKVSGYRSVHLIYRYYSDKKQTYNGLKIEVQLRSPLQHAWATAVETVGTFTQQALKSSQGEEKWLRFFALMGTAIARRERTPLVDDTPTNKKVLINELREHALRLNVEGHLHAYGMAIQTLDEHTKDAHYFLLKLEPAARRISVKGFNFNEFERASEEYLNVERNLTKDAGEDAVLVSVDSLAALKRAYPNYFLDTHVFISAVREVLTGG